MSNYVYNSVKIELLDHVKISAKAGDLSVKSMRRIAKPVVNDLDTVCQQLAQLMEDNPEFTVPEVDAAMLRTLGARSGNIKTHIAHIESVLRAFKQQKLLDDDAAYRMVRQVNDQVRTQSKYNAWIKVKFRFLADIFSRGKPDPAMSSP